MNPQYQTEVEKAASQTLWAQLYGHFSVPGGDERAYDLICDRVGFPRRTSPGLLGHFAGPCPGGWETIDIWTDLDHMERVFSEFLVDAISSTVRSEGARIDIEPETREIARLVVGPDAERHLFENGADVKCAERGVRPLGVLIENLGGGEEEYLAGCDLLGFPEQIPDGMIVHIAGESRDGWRVFDCWQSAEQADAWAEQVRASISSVDAGSGMMAAARIRRFEPVRAFVRSGLAGGGHPSL